MTKFPEDKRLIKQLRDGDREALSMIYEKYKDRLLTIASFLVNDTATAEDCLHDVFMTLAAKAPEFNIRTSLKGYLTVSVVNRARDQLRKKARHNVADIDAVDVGGVHAPPSEQMEFSEQMKRVLAAMAELPVEQREVVTLHLQGDLTFREIAGQMDISINTVLSRYRYGITKLQKRLAGNG